MVSLTEAFSILELPYGASDDDVRRAYKAAALKYHPDKVGGDADMFHRIKAARDIILLDWIDELRDIDNEFAAADMSGTISSDATDLQEWHIDDVDDVNESEYELEARIAEEWHKGILDDKDEPLAATFDEIYDKAVLETPAESLGIIVTILPEIIIRDSMQIAATSTDMWTTDYVQLADIITDEQIAAGSTHIVIQQGSITHIKADCVVSSVSHSLQKMPGIDTAIREAGGDIISSQLNKYAANMQPLIARPGNVYLTDGGRLPSAYVIHCVVDNSLIDLRTCYWNALTMAAAAGFRTIAFCGLAMGRGGMLEKAAKTAAKTISLWINANPGAMDVIALFGFQEHEWRVLDSCARQYLTVI